LIVGIHQIIAPLAGRAGIFRDSFQGRRATCLPLAIIFRAYGAVVLPLPRSLYSLLALLVVAALLSIPPATNSQSGRQKPANSNSNSNDNNTRPRQVATPRNSNSSTNQQTNAPTASKSDPEQGKGEDATDVVRVTSNLVPVPTSVVDARGIALTNLKLEDFELRIDGQPNLISDISRSETPVRMAMLFDNSGSLSESRDFEKRAAVRFFQNVMRPSDQAAVYSVSTNVELAQPMTSDVRRLEQTIESFGKPDGATSLYDALFDALAYLKPYAARRVVVIVSDGRDTTSRLPEHDFDNTLQRLLSDDCQVYVVQTGIYDNANVRDLAAERRMQEFSSQTGGAAYIPKSVSELDDAFAQISADLAQQYILSYYPAADKRDGRFHIIAVSVKARPNARVRARKGFVVKAQYRV
jgi:Ca-activated chloride channel family protein